jgi:acyl transferase domain-containing protein
MTTLLTGGAAPVSKPDTKPELLARQARLVLKIEALKTDLEIAHHDGIEFQIKEAANWHAELTGKLARTQNELADVRRALERLAIAEAPANAEAAEAEKKERRLDLAACTRRQVDLAARVQKAAQELGAAMRDLLANGIRIADLAADILPAGPSGVTEAKRLYSFSAVTLRIRLALFRAFDAPDDMPRQANGLPISFFPFEPPVRGEAQLKHTLPEREVDVLDNIPLAVFETFEEAVEARNRRDPTGKNLHPVTDEFGLWTLKAGRLRGAGKYGGPPDRAA